MVHTIWFRFDLIRFRKVFSVWDALSPVSQSTKKSICDSLQIKRNIIVLTVFLPFGSYSKLKPSLRSYSFGNYPVNLSMDNFKCLQNQIHLASWIENRQQKLYYYNCCGIRTWILIPFLVTERCTNEICNDCFNE